MIELRKKLLVSKGTFFKFKKKVKIKHRWCNVHEGEKRVL